MEFTREPVIETVITPKDGCKLVIRSSKNAGQEEYFVDAIEVVSFGNSFFFRSLEKPKAFLVPTSDYEVLEVRETRMVLKNVGLDRSIKIAGGREGAIRPPKEQSVSKVEADAEVAPPEGTSGTEVKPERIDRKRDRRRGARRRRGTASESQSGEKNESLTPGSDSPQLEQPHDQGMDRTAVSTGATLTNMLTSLLPPPPNLIRETIQRYKEKDEFKNAFYKEPSDAAEGEVQIEGQPAEATASISLSQPEYGSFESSVEEEEYIRAERAKQFSSEEKGHKETRLGGAEQEAVGEEKRQDEEFKLPWEE